VAGEGELFPFTKFWKKHNVLKTSFVSVFRQRSNKPGLRYSKSLKANEAVNLLRYVLRTGLIQG
jgi:hypothetical protein